MTTPAGPGPSMPAPRAVALRAALDASRAALLASIGKLAERDFTSSLPSGETVVAALVGLARLERDAVEAARVAIDAPVRPRLGGGEPPQARPLPPQVIHDLAGARYETGLFLDSLLTDQLDTAAGDATVEALLVGIVVREQATAEQVSGSRATSASSP